MNRVITVELPTMGARRPKVTLSGVVTAHFEI